MNPGETPGGASLESEALAGQAELFGGAKHGRGFNLWCQRMYVRAGAAATWPCVRTPLLSVRAR
jgi:hypothetical protein